MFKLAASMAPDLKHTNEWGCEVCGRPAKVTKYNIASWSHLAQPRANFYIHNICNAERASCNQVIQAQDAMMAEAGGGGLLPGLPTPIDENGQYVYDLDPPLASSCVKCKDPKTAEKGFKMSRCGRCKLTRYCCPGCQREDWPRHKITCKAVESVKWVWPGPDGSA